MKQIDHALTSKLQEIVSLQTELQSQKDKFDLFLKSNESYEKLKAMQFKIISLKAELKKKESDALTLFN